MSYLIYSDSIVDYVYQRRRTQICCISCRTLTYIRKKYQIFYARQAALKTLGMKIPR